MEQYFYVKNSKTAAGIRYVPIADKTLKIVRHSGAQSLTEKVYTHLDVSILLEAINKI